MKPRFSILTVLGLTLYVAVAVVGAANPLSLWGFAVFPIWIVAAMWCIHRTAQGPGARYEFAKAFVIASTALVTLEMFTAIPGSASRTALEALHVVDRFEAGDVAVRYGELLKAHAGLWVACLCGLVAAWQSRVDTTLRPTDDSAARIREANDTTLEA